MNASNKKPVASSQSFAPIEEIRDGVVLMKDRSLRMILMVSSLNFSLKSADEQQGLVLQYQNFLNGLDFDIQFFVQSRKLDIKPYLATLEERYNEQLNDLLKIQTREYIEFIRNFTSNTNIMAKSFFVVVPYSPPVLAKTGRGLWNRLWGRGTDERPRDEVSEFALQRTQLEQRASVVAGGLSSLGLRTIVLGTEELVELFFKLFNPGENDAPNLEQNVAA